jgi:mannan endo-1,4-beta-mannosidase
MKSQLFFLLISFLLVISTNGHAQTSNEGLTCNQKASPSAIKVLKTIYKIKEEGKFLTCQHVRERTADLFSSQSEYKHIYDVTGKYPAIVGVDFYQDPKAAVKCALQQWRRGGLVTITWHQSSPLKAFQGGWNTVSTQMSPEDFKSLITPGTALYNTWLEHIDKMAENLKILQDSGVVVLWRPYHEMNGSWFWWCDKGEDFRQLWKNMYQRFTEYHHLNNLIWIFGPNIGCKDPALFFPGLDYVDIGGLDIYNNVRKLDKPEHDRIKKVLNGKPVAMTETGLLPPVQDMIDQSEYVWFMPWTTGWCDNTFYGMPGANGPGNTADYLKEFYLNSEAISLENLGKYFRE